MHCRKTMNEIVVEIVSEENAPYDTKYVIRQFTTDGFHD